MLPQKVVIQEQLIGISIWSPLCKIQTHKILCALITLMYLIKV
jgi:predicted transcriptional regulator